MARSRCARRGAKPNRRTTTGGKTPRRRSAKPCARCASGNATYDAGAWVLDHRLIDESHLMVSAMHCRGCSHHAIKIWTELIDWTNGDDSSASLIVPLPAGTAVDQASLGSEFAVRALLRRLGPCPYLITCHPSGGDASPWRWCSGVPSVLPHD